MQDYAICLNFLPSKTESTKEGLSPPIGRCTPMYQIVIQGCEAVNAN
jgi:hypothetical protein